MISVTELMKNFEETKNSRIEAANTEYSNRMKALEKVKVLEGLEFPDDVRIETYMLGNTWGTGLGHISIICNSFDKLHEVRSILRTRIDGYSDKLLTISASGDKAIIVYETCNEIVRVEVKVPPKDVPPSLFPKDSCGFKKVRRTQLEFSCDFRKGA